MKRLALFILLALFVKATLTSQPCLDVVHPTNYRVSISNCCIKDIKEGNVVVYAKDGKTNEIEAIAINLKGEYIELKENNDSIRNIVLLNNYPEGLYQEHNYEYYLKMHNKQNGRMILGILTAGVGVGLLTGGIIHMQNYENNGFLDWDGTGIGMTIIGMAAIGVGIPIAIVGGTKKHKYKQAMLEIERNAKLTFRTTNNGFGLVLNF